MRGLKDVTDHAPSRVTLREPRLVRSSLLGIAF
jgi:hypothetical protein